jgi:CheY-like chemotaxis protein
MQRLLGREGFEVFTARDGDEGLKLARAISPAVITLDVLMPGRDGWSVIQELKSDPELAGIPVVMVTIVDDQPRGYAMGAAEYLNKPVDRAKLAGILKRHAGVGAGRHALVVEDDAGTRQVLARMLVGEGWQVTEAENGMVALAKLAGARPDLVILDLMMPQMDGFEFLAEFRKDAAMRRVPVVVVTAADLTDEDRRRLNGAVERVLQKAAYSNVELLDEVRELIYRGIGGTG